MIRTVAELVAALSTYPPDMRVVTPGFDEAGLSDSISLTEIGARWNVRSPTTHFAPHEENEDGERVLKIDGEW